MISVIIPVFNDASALRACLESLRWQTLPRSEYEVLVVDNGSATSPGDIVREYEFARYLFEATPGSYNARNSGVRAASGDLLAFTDADCVPASDWLESASRRLSAAPNTDALGGRIVLTVSVDRTPAELFELVVQPFLQQQYVEQMGFAATANLIVRREAFLAVGPFDGTRMSSGDKEWGRRLSASGRKLDYAAEVIVSHPARRSLAALIRKHRRIVGGRTAKPADDGPAGYAAWNSRIRRDLSTTVRTLVLRPSRLGLSWREASSVLLVAVILAMARTLENMRVAIGVSPLR